jgi:hypothetical protein
MNRSPSDTVLQDGPNFRIEDGPRGRTVVRCLGGREHRESFADFVAAERRHALALRRAAIDQAAADLGRALARLSLRLRRRLIVAAGRTLQSLPASARRAQAAG